MNIRFEKNNFWIRPVDGGKLAIPDDFKIQILLPPQTNDPMEQEQKEGITRSTRSFLITQILFKEWFKTSMQLVFGSVIALQILAHLPLANILLPANAMESFDIMVKVVSFDYFPLHEYVEFGFTPTEPWSVSFEYLDYESINFIEGLGSINLCFWLGTLYLIFIAGLYRCKCQCTCRGKNFFTPMSAWYSTLGFLQGVFFEVMVSLSVSMKIFSIYEYLNLADKFNIANQLIVFIIFAVYVVFLTYFTFWRMPRIVAIHQMERIKKNQALLE